MGGGALLLIASWLKKEAKGEGHSWQINIPDTCKHINYREETNLSWGGHRGLLVGQCAIGPAILVDGHRERHE